MCRQVDASLHPPLFWVDAGKAQNKVRHQVFLPGLHCPPLAPIYPHCLPPLPVLLSHIKPCGLPFFHPNPSRYKQVFGRERAVFEPFLSVFQALFFVAGPSLTPVPFLNACLSQTFFLIFFWQSSPTPSVFPWKTYPVRQRPLQVPQPPHITLFPFFWSGGSFFGRFFCSCPYCPSLSFFRLATITFLLPVWLTGCRLAPNLEPTSPMSLPTHLQFACACCALSPSPKPISSPQEFTLRAWAWVSPLRFFTDVWLYTIRRGHQERVSELGVSPLVFSPVFFFTFYNRGPQELELRWRRGGLGKSTF